MDAASSSANRYVRESVGLLTVRVHSICGILTIATRGIRIFRDTP